MKYVQWTHCTTCEEGNGAEGGTRTRMGSPTRPSNVRVYQFHHFGMERIIGTEENSCQ